MGSLKAGASFHSSILQLIDRLYPRASQKTASIILKAYFTQDADVRRRITLEALGNLDSLEKKVTRERSRQILFKFKNEDLPKEFKLLQQGIKYEDDILKETRRDLLNLVEVIQTICESLKSYSLPIFAERVQQDLKDNNLIDNSLYFPLVVELAESVSVETDFDIYDHDGYRIILKKGSNQAHYTSELIKQAGKIATHMGGVYPISKLFNPEWHRNLPDSLNYIHNEVNEQYKIDLLQTQPDLILLNDDKYFSFIERDERISSMLLPIFKAYSDPIPKVNLLNALKMGLTQRFMSKPNSQLREHELEIIDNSGDAIDEFCTRTLLLNSVNEVMRSPGQRITKYLESYEPGELYEAQINIVNEIRKHGKPVSSMEFGKLYREVLNLRGSFKVSLYTYPVLYYKEGEGRRNDFYKTLDGVYELHKEPPQVIVDTVDTVDTVDAEVTEADIKSLYKKLEGIEFDDLPVGQLRVEQRLLRKYLIEKNSSFSEHGSKCQICNKYYPKDLLIAAHVKKRSMCNDDEKMDIKNIAMLQCASCDKLFENGYIYISDIGVIEINQHAPATPDLGKELNQLSNNRCDYYDGSHLRLSYIQFHRKLSINRFLKVDVTD
ncbi:TPA: HNH endonuclease [Vibrio parahaemolyticus]